MNDPRLVDLERQRWAPRQLLRSRDLRDQLVTSAHLRLWHNRGVHDSFGVAVGLEVALTQDQSAAIVQPGVAHDRVGRPLRLLAPRTVTLPEDQQPMTLAARARDDAGLAEPELDWLPPQPATDLGPWVPLAQLRFKDGEPGLDGRDVPRARRLARPHLGWGSTPADGTAWEPWLVFCAAVGLQVTVDTRAAGFTDVPCYFAWLQWPEVGSSRLDYWFYVFLAVQYVEEPAADRFVFRVAMPASTRYLPGRGGREAERELEEEDLVSIARSQRLSVCWLGVQGDHEGDR